MTDWTQQVLARLTEARDAAGAFEQISAAARHLGFEHCAYGLRKPFPFTRLEARMLSTYDEGWNRRYLEAGYLQVDPTVLHGIHSLQPVVWSDRLFRRAPQLWEEAQSFGLRVGWAQSIFDADGRIGMLSLARSSGRLSEAERRAHDPLLRWLVNTAHCALSQYLGRSPLSEMEPLTARQLEVMRWTADGKTSEEIAAILGLSTPTVNFHIRNAIAKLRANNKNSAVARSSRLGILG
ncbi:autoinducer binding domain-containing protein [Variovorax paradoxus]|uniref:autoinducer binding domain-containing protein n=1 Tax=Variovorax paradoxus TaxID=34073 RepID=UPI003D657B84